MATKNAINSNIPIEISLGGTATTTFSHVDGPVYYDGSGLNSIAIGTAGQILVSNGPGAGATFQTVTGAGASVPIGALDYFCNSAGSAYLSPSWLLCDGSLLSQATYSVLYARIGLIDEGEWAEASTPQDAGAICYGSGLYVAGTGSSVMSSTDALTWTNIVATSTAQGITCLAYGGGKYLLGGDQGLTQTSTDAISWGATVTALTGGISRLDYGLSHWVAVGGGGSLATSTNGSTWKTVYLANSNDMAWVYASTTEFIACGPPFQGRSMPPNLLSSTDAVSWYSSIPNIGGATDYDDGGMGGPALSWDGSKFLACGYNVGPITSTNGYYWTALTQTFPFNNDFSVVHGGSYYLMSSTGGQLAYSTDGLSWTRILSGTVADIHSLLHTGTNLWVYGAELGVIGSTTDVTSTTFTPHTLLTTGGFRGLAYNGSNLYVAIGTVGVTYAAIGTSTDAVTWATRTATDMITDMFSITFGGGKFLAGGGSGTVATSTNGIAWSVSGSPTSSNINCVAYLGGNFYYAGQGGALGYSTDAVTWTDISFQPNHINGLAYSGTSYIAGGTGWAATSATGTSGWVVNSPLYPPNWSVTANPYLNAVTYSNSMWLAADSNGSTFTSTDALTWTTATTGGSAYTHLGSGFGSFIGCNNGGPVIATSTDGVAWYQASAGGDGTDDITTGTSRAVISSFGPHVYISYSGTPYDHTTSFLLPTDAEVAITRQTTSQFKRGLYIKAL